MKIGPVSVVAFLVVFVTACSGDSTSKANDLAVELAADVVEATTDLAVPPEDVVPEPVEPHLEQFGDFTVVFLSGTPYQMGKQHGELLHDVIDEAVQFVMADPVMAAIPLLAKEAGILDMAVANSYPDILQECKGLVDATKDVGFTMDLCLTLNFGDVMLDLMASGDRPGCTGVVAGGAATVDGVLLHTRNLDWGSMNIDIIHQHPVIFVRQPSDGIPHIYVGFPLNLSPYTGMNLAGISIGSHEGEPATADDLSTTGRSHVQMLGQLLKSATSLDEVTSFIQEQKHMSVEALVVADGKGGQGAVFEMTASGLGIRSFTDDAVWATNHFVHPDMVGKHATASMGSKMRFERLVQLVSKDSDESLWGTLDPQAIASVMRDTTHPVTGETATLEQLEPQGWDNDWSIGANGPMHFALFQPETGLFWVAAGTLPIHKQPYHCFSLRKLLGYPDAPECPFEIP